MVLRLAGIALLLLTLTGCAGPGPFGPQSGTVTGHVVIRACGGAYRPDQTSCSSSPLAGAMVSFHANGKTFSAAADSSGAYRIALKPGTYTAEVNFRFSTVSNRVLPAEPFPRVGPRQVSVSAGKTITADFTYVVQLL